MNHFDYRGGQLHAEDVPVSEIVKAHGTPTYVYATATIERHVRVLKDSLPEGTLIAYAVKANGNISVLRTMALLGAGADIVSEGELRRALAAGIPAGKVVFSGVGKTAGEIAFALECGIHQFNVESEPELMTLSRIAEQKGQLAAIAFRINPSVDAQTHAKITTGTDENKFGVPIENARALYAQASRLPGIKPIAVDVHIGSQITSLGPLRAAFQKVAELVHSLRGDGHTIERVDLGGGLGVPYAAHLEAPPSPKAYGDMIRAVFSGVDVSLIVEPGRLIMANAGILVSQVIYIKRAGERQFLILDAGMNDLIRPALYDAWHDIVPVASAESNRPLATYDIVGPVCESSDIFASSRQMPTLNPGDFVAILGAGAYGAAQASSYNARPLAAEVLVRGRHFFAVRPRQTYEAMLAAEPVAPWLEDPNAVAVQAV